MNIIFCRKNLKNQSIFLCSLLLTISVHLNAQTFQTTIGFPLPINEYGVSGLVSNQGNYVILGSNIKNPQGLYNDFGDIHMLWLNSTGQVLNPTKLIGQDIMETGVWFEKAIDCNGVPGYIIAANEYGAGHYNMIVTYTNLAGIPIWSLNFGSSTFDERSSCIKQDNSGNFILTGTKTNNSSGISTVLAAKINCAGVVVWFHEYIVGLTAEASSVTAMATAPNPCVGSINEYFITGNTVPPPAGNQATFILGLNATTGISSFLKFYDLGPGTDDIALCIQGICPSQLVPLGQLIVSGYSVDAFDLMNPKKVMLFSTDLFGALLWANTYDIQNSSREFSTHFQFDLHNNIILTGKAEETGISDPAETGHCLLMNLGQNGTPIFWTNVFEMGFSSHGARVEVTPKNDFFITGHSFSIPTFRQSNYDILAILSDSLGRTQNSCFHDASTIIKRTQPTVTPSNPQLIVHQDFRNTMLDFKYYQDRQFHCPADPCDSININANFNYTVNGNMASFTDISSVSSGTIISWSWDFGDSNTSNSASPVHSYTSPGIYVVCLTVSVSLNGMICRDSVCKEIIIRSMPGDRCDVVNLNASFSFTGSGNTFFFTDQSSINPNFTITSWTWNFGDGNNSSLQNPSHTYAALGNYTVCLAVTSISGMILCHDTICKTIMVPFEPNDSCLANIVKNGSFEQGAIAGDLGGGGQLNDWVRYTWSPQIINFDYCRDSFSVQMWGNQLVGEGIMQSVTIQKGGIYQVSFCGKRLNTSYPNAQARFRAHVNPTQTNDYYNCNIPNCDEIFLSPVLTPNWVQYVSSPWVATDHYDMLTITVWNNYNTLNKAFTSWLRIDDICIERIGSVATQDQNETVKALIYPNPVYGILNIQFDSPLSSPHKIYIFNPSGRLLHSFELEKGSTLSTVDMEPYSPGIYFIKSVNADRKSWIAKFIKF
jgi:PKD repeat protein